MVAGSGAAVVAGSVPMTFIHSGSSVVASRGSGVGDLHTISPSTPLRAGSHPDKLRDFVMMPGEEVQSPETPISTGIGAV